jgi:hypothetical protein
MGGVCLGRRSADASVMGGVCLGRRSADAAAEIRADVVAPHSVALVGGPCGGKTSVIPVLRAQL